MIEEHPPRHLGFYGPDTTCTTFVIGLLVAVAGLHYFVHRLQTPTRSQKEYAEVLCSNVQALALAFGLGGPRNSNELSNYAIYSEGCRIYLRTGLLTSDFLNLVEAARRESEGEAARKDAELNEHMREEARKARAAFECKSQVMAHCPPDLIEWCARNNAVAIARCDE